MTTSSTTIQIPLPFAKSGTQTPIDLTRSDGVVNLTLGYTDDYSRQLGTDPAAKPVERDKMNWLFNVITSNIIDWQNMAIPQWLSGVAYNLNALVRWSPNISTQPEKIYRCINPSTSGSNPSTTAFWEEMISTGAMKALIPMLDSGVISTPTDFNTIGKGWWYFTSQATVNSSPNSPPNVVNPGVLEVYSWNSGALIWQNYNDVAGNSWERGFNGSAWTAWQQIAVRGTTLQAYGITNALYGQGAIPDATNLNTLISTTGASYVRGTTPDAGSSNYPTNQPGTLFIFGTNTGGTNWIQAQYYHAADNSVWTRFGRSGAWNAWQQMVTNAQAILNSLLAANNTWTGTNTWQNTGTFTVPGNGLNWYGLANVKYNSSSMTVDCGMDVLQRDSTNTAKTYHKSFHVNYNGQYGIYDRDAGAWLLYGDSTSGLMNLSSHAYQWSMNIDKSFNSCALFMNVNGLNNSSRIIADSISGVSILTDNTTDNGFQSWSLRRDGTLATAGNILSPSAFYAGYNYSNGTYTGQLANNGDVYGSVWGNQYLSSYLNPHNFVRNASGSNDVRLYWDGRLESWVDGGYQGTIAWTSDLAGYWDKGSFLRPDQGGWGGQIIPIGTTGVTLPNGGVWAFLYFDMLASSVSRFTAGTAAGGSVIWPYSASGSSNNGVFLRWRIY